MDNRLGCVRQQVSWGLWMVHWDDVQNRRDVSPLMFCALQLMLKQNSQNYKSSLNCLISLVHYSWLKISCHFQIPKEEIKKKKLLWALSSLFSVNLIFIIHLDLIKIEVILNLGQSLYFLKFYLYIRVESDYPFFALVLILGHHSLAASLWNMCNY